jgi:DNA-binding HxlR family transcriptional regulator/putative sterol carrier protein
VAKALDVVGERWSLLLVRELFDGPKRYSDLLEGAPGISTDVLAARLRDLEDAGVIARRTLPPPAASKVYELTARGRDLAPVLGALSRWGMSLLGARGEDEAFRPQWLATGLRGMLRPSRAKDVDLSVDFDLGSGDPVRIRVHDGRIDAVAEPDGRADLVVRGDLETLAELADGSLAVADALRDGLLVLEGTEESVRLYQRLFPQPRAGAA